MSKYEYCQITVYVNGVCINDIYNGVEITYHPKYFQRMKEILDMPDDGTGFVTPDNLERES